MTLLALELHGPADPRSFRRAHAYASRAGYAVSVTITRVGRTSSRYEVAYTRRIQAGWTVPRKQTCRSMVRASVVAADWLAAGLDWLASREDDGARGAMPTDWTMRGAA